MFSSCSVHVQFMFSSCSQAAAPISVTHSRAVGAHGARAWAGLLTLHAPPSQAAAPISVTHSRAVGAHGARAWAGLLMLHAPPSQAATPLVESWPQAAAAPITSSHPPRRVMASSSSRPRGRQHPHERPRREGARPVGVLVCSLGGEGGGLWSAQASERRSGAAMPLVVVTMVRGGLGAAGRGGHASWRCDYGQRWPRGIDYRPPL